MSIGFFSKRKRFEDDPEELEETTSIRTPQSLTQAPGPSAIDNARTIAEAANTAKMLAAKEAVTKTTTATTEAAAKAAQQQGIANGVAQAAGVVAQTADPQGSHYGPALSGAAQGAATGTMIAPGYGTAIGAVIGLGLGLMQADNKRKQINSKAEGDVMAANAAGLERAAAKSNVKFTFGGQNRRKLTF